MNLDHFYTVSARKLLDDHRLQVCLSIHDDHPVFKGHFPEHPVLPGVALLQIIKELSEAHKGISLFMKNASRVKFVNLVNPTENNELVFTLSILEEDGFLKVKNSTTFANETPVMHCSLTFQKTEDTSRHPGI